MPRESCPSCGAAVDVPVDGWTRCPDCGFEVGPSGGSEPEPADAARAPPSRDHGPVGEDRDPVLVVVLSLITFGIYRLYWLWVVSEEIDDYDPDAKSAHKLVKIGYVAIAVALVALLVALAGLLASGSMRPGAGPDAAMAGFGLFMGLAVLALIVAFLLPLIGEYRLWTKIRDDEVRADVRDPLDPVIQLVLVLVPIVNIVGFWIALYRTQDHLNDVWARAQKAGGAPQTV